MKNLMNKKNIFSLCTDVTFRDFLFKKGTYHFFLFLKEKSSKKEATLTQASEYKHLRLTRCLLCGSKP